jgi:hypothetical protein
MIDVSEVTAVVIDRGTFFPVAERLAREFKKVYYHRPNGESFETVATGCMGDGLSDVELIEDFWKIKKDVNLFVFPDCTDGGLQAELEGQGFPVWGSKGAGELEKMRGQWIKLCEELGLPMPKTERVRGLSNLRQYLKEREGEKLFVKISRFRGDMETWEVKTPEQVANKLDYLTLRWGPLREKILFYVQEPVETEIESGTDTYNIHGHWPDEIIEGYEKKGETYFATVKPRVDLSDELWRGNYAISAMLQRERYANFLSSEIRVKDKEGYWLDPCLRCPSPAGEEQLEMLRNFGTIVWHGAHGILEQPDWEAQFCGEAVISYLGDKETWKTIKIPKEIKRWIKLYACAYADGAYHYPPSQDHEAIGCAVALGDTPKEVVENLKELEEALEGEPLELQIEPLVSLFKQIEEAEEHGLDFTDKPMPETDEVMS